MTSKRHPSNERVKRRYLEFLADVKGRDPASVDTVAKALERFDEYNKRRDFVKFHIEQARGFKAYLIEQRNARTGALLSASTINSTLGGLKAFFVWLAGEPGYRSALRYADAEYFNPPENLTRVATAHRRRPCPTLAQIRTALGAMPAKTDIERRDRTLLAFTILTGARDSATVSFKLKHVDIGNRLLEQDARDVQTKRAKTFRGSSPSATTSRTSSWNGSSSCAKRSGSDLKTRSFRSPTSSRGLTCNSPQLASTTRRGPMRTRSARCSSRCSRASACPISTRTASATPSSSSLTS
jgi:integrase